MRKSTTLFSSSSQALGALCFFALLDFCHAEDEKQETLAQAKARHKKADKVLNSTYREVLKQLEKHRVDDYKKDQRAWIGYRDYMAEHQAALIHIQHGEEVKQTVTYWSSMADLTESRSQHLKHWVGVKSNNGWNGDYVDGTGGHLTIKEVDGKLEFYFEVVRGPTFHIGELKGKAEVNQFMARFTETNVDKGE